MTPDPLTAAREALAYLDTLGRYESRPNLEPHLRAALAEADRLLAALAAAEGERDGALARVRELDAVLDAIARSTNPKGGCLAECASWRDDDCDCGYVEACDDAGAYADAALRGGGR